LTRELAALGSNATQEELDKIGAQYSSHNAGVVFDDAHSRIISELDSVLRVLKQEQSSLASYNKLLGETVNRINSKTTTSAELLSSAIDILSEATGSTMAHGEKTVENVTQRSQEMDLVRKELDEYKRIANTDSLTRLSNRRAFDDRLANVFDNPMTKPVTALVLADIDYFKKINDTYGHPVGDRVLTAFAEFLRARVRKTDLIARYGGEEFGVILPGAGLRPALRKARKLIEELAKSDWAVDATTKLRFTASMGVAAWHDGDDSAAMIERVDRALYRAKHEGRNRVEKAA
jgi:diguanylate cyclase